MIIGFSPLGFLSWGPLPSTISGSGLQKRRFAIIRVNSRLCIKDPKNVGDNRAPSPAARDSGFQKLLIPELPPPAFFHRPCFILEYRFVAQPQKSSGTSSSAMSGGLRRRNAP